MGLLQGCDRQPGSGERSGVRSSNDTLPLRAGATSTRLTAGLPRPAARTAARTIALLAHRRLAPAFLVRHGLTGLAVITRFALEARLSAPPSAARLLVSPTEQRSRNPARRSAGPGPVGPCRSRRQQQAHPGDCVRAGTREPGGPPIPFVRGHRSRRAPAGRTPPRRSSADVVGTVEPCPSRAGETCCLTLDRRHQA